MQLKESVVNDEHVRIAPLSAVSRTMIKPTSWMHIIEFIERLILDKKHLISLVGEPRSGKTTFVELLQKELASSISIYKITAEAHCNQAAFKQELKILLSSKENQQEHHTLLVIDDAHHLPKEFMEEILNELDEQGENAYFHICLVVSSLMTMDLHELIQEKYPDMLHSIELGALNEAETERYVAQNGSIPKQILAERIKSFYELTEGRIENINRYMSDFFNYRAKKSLSIVKILQYVGSAIGIFIAAVGVVYLWLSKDFQSAPVHVLSLESPTQHNLSKIEIEPALESEIPAYTMAATRQFLEVASIRRVDLNRDEEEDKPDENLVVTDKVIVAPKILPHKIDVSEEEATAPLIQETTKNISEPKSNSSLASQKIEKERYTIQILASHNKRELQRFASLHHLNEKIKIRLIQHQGASWYALTFGEYRDRAMARQAINQLPEALAQFKPWIRSLADLKRAG